MDLKLAWIESEEQVAFEPEGMSDDDLLRRLKEEETDAASYYASELAKDQADAMNRYYGQPFGNEKPNRSQVVTPDVMDAVNWALPTLLRPFVSSEDFLVIESNEDADLTPVADYIGHVFFKDNPGEQIIHDYAFDGLVQRVGIVKTSWEDPEPKPAREFEGMPAAQLQRYMQDPEYRVLAAAPADAQRSTFNVLLQHVPKMGRVVVEAIAPENFAISRRATSIKTADYHRIKYPRLLLSEVQRMFPDKHEELEEGRGGGASDDNDSDPRISSRFQGETQRRVFDGDDGEDRVDLLAEYLRCDYDGDGAVELRAIKRVGDVILENVSIYEPEVSIWSPIRVAHRAIGLSLADTVIPYQKIRSEITRRGLDNLAQVLHPRKLVNIDALDDSDPNTLQRVLDGDIGGTVPVRGDVRAAYADLVTPDVSGPAAQMLEYFDQRKQEASGIMAHSQGMNPDSANKTATGIDLLQASGNARIEIMARWLASGLEEVFNRILKLVCQYQDQPRMLKLRGKPVELTPALWPDDLLVRVHVGMANSTRERQIANLSTIVSAQKELLVQAGPSNPIAGMPELRNTLARLAEAMGYKSPEAFFREIPKDYQAPEAGPDPKMAEVQGKQQLAEAEAQSRAQLQQQEQQHAQAMAQTKLASETELARIKAQTDKEIALIKVQSEQQIAAAKADAELRLAHDRMAQEMALAQQRMHMEADLARQRADREHEISLKRADDDAKLKTYRSGGKLDA